MRINTTDIKARFAAIQQKHLAKWERSNPIPKPPEVSAVMRELRQGKVTVNPRKLAKALSDERYDRPRFDDVVTTASMQRHASAMKQWEAAHESFIGKLQDAKDSYLDRVLFDHESGFLLLRDFQNWTPRLRAAAPVLTVVKSAAA